MMRFAILVAITFCGSARLSLASVSCDHECVLDRLADLEQKQRTSDAENRELREIISEQQSTIEAQARRIDLLEKTISALDLTEGHVREKPKKDAEHSPNEPTHVGSRTVASWQPKHLSGDVLKPIEKRQERAGIAFTAYLDHNIDLSNHRTIKFNKIILNEGSAYSVHTGAFTCPESGVYLMTFSVGGREGRSLAVSMVRNSNNVVNGNADSMHDHQELQGGNTVFIRLNVNDVVWVEAAEDNDYIEGSSTIRLSTFSGAFLYA